MPITPQWELRAEFARRLSHMYGKEVPAYTTLLEVSQAVNDAVLSRPGSDAERLGSIARVTAERHGAIRVGTPQEMAQVARVFAAMGMHPVGFYDLREAAASSVPVVSTPSGPRTGGTGAQPLPGVHVHARARGPPLLQRRSAAAPREFPRQAHVVHHRTAGPRRPGERVPGADFRRREMFLTLATAAFKLSTEAVDRAWYHELEQVSSVPPTSAASPAPTSTT